MWTAAQRPCGLGKLLPVLTSPSSEDIFPKYRHSLKIAFLSILPTNEDNSEEILGKTVDCFPSPPTLPLTHLTMSQAQNWVMAFLCSLWIQTRPRPYIGQVDTGMSSEVTGAQRIEGTSIFELSEISGLFFPPSSSSYSLTIPSEHCFPYNGWFLWKQMRKWVKKYFKSLGLIKFASLTSECLLVHSWCWELSPLPNSLLFASPWKETLYLWSPHSSFSSSLSPWQPLVCLWPPMDLGVLDISHEQIIRYVVFFVTGYFHLALCFQGSSL